MNFTLHLLSQPGERIQFHAFVIALILTGVFMLLTASDLGAMGPLVISVGLYVIFFGVVTELLLGARLLIARIALRLFVKRLAHAIDLTPGGF